MAFADFLRSQFEPLQYAAFFGTLIVFAAAEALIPQRDGQGQRASRWPANYVLTLLNILVVSAVPVSGLFAADWATGRGIGLIALMGLSAWAAVVLGILARSLVNYCVHVAMHKLPVLWRLHRVHHSDVFFDVSTAVRFHPLEFAVQIPVSLAAIAALGIPPVAIIVYELIDAAMAVWTHANVRLPARLERILNPVLVTPAMHRIHHSADPRETDSNYGATLAVWDRLFGTYRARSGDELAAMTLGLNECQDERSRSLLWLLKVPFMRRLALRPAGGDHASS